MDGLNRKTNRAGVEYTDAQPQKHVAFDEDALRAELGRRFATERGAECLARAVAAQEKGDERKARYWIRKATQCRP